MGLSGVAEFRVVSPIETRYTKTGQAVGQMRIVWSDSFKNKATQKWEDRDTTFADLIVWGEEIESFAKLAKGDKGIAEFRKISIRKYKRKDGSEGQQLELTAGKPRTYNRERGDIQPPIAISKEEKDFLNNEDIPF